jgi:hypothetical protein
MADTLEVSARLQVLSRLCGVDAHDVTEEHTPVESTHWSAGLSRIVHTSRNLFL